MGKDARVVVARQQPFAHQPAQVGGERGVRIVDRLVLADLAAQLARDLPRARLERGIGEPLLRQHRAGLHRRGDQHRKRREGEEATGHHSRSSLATIGASTRATVSSSSAPTWRWRIVPSRPTTKVSGTP